jgi:hypothetical protein
MKQKTIHISFTKDDMDLYHELMRESCLSYVPTSVLIRNYLKTGMKTNQRPFVSN